jgi:hypothetical protein
MTPRALSSYRRRELGVDRGVIIGRQLADDRVVIRIASDELQVVFLERVVAA